MATFFLISALLGGAFLALQIVMALFGLAHDVELPGAGVVAHADLHAGDGLNLLGFRAVTAAALFFGLVGLAVQQSPLYLLALPAGLAAGLAAAASVAWVMRAMVRLETDGGERLQDAVGQTGTVYLGIPPGRGGSGKVHLTLSGRLVECRAQAEQALPTGTSVLVVDVVAPDLVEVIPSPQIGA